MSRSHVRRTWIVENKWVCSSCSTTCQGRDIRCPQCGSPKEKPETDVINPSTAAVTDPGLLKLANQTAHWECEFCGSKQRDPDGNCTSCGGAKARTEVEAAARASNGHSTVPETGEKIHILAVPPRQVDLSKIRQRLEQPTVEPTIPVTPSPRLSPILGFVILGALIIMGLVLLLWPWKKEAVVSSTFWNHTTTQEQRSTEHDSGWGHPSGAFNTTCVSRQHGTYKCSPYDCRPHSVSYKCRPHDCSCRKICTDKGNGFSSCSEHCSTCYDSCSKTEYDTCYRQCPKYENWCEYDYYKWTTVGEKSATGEEASEAKWASFSEKSEILRERRTAIYKVNFQAKSNAYTYTPVNLIDLGRFHKGDRWIIKVPAIGPITPIERKLQ